MNESATENRTAYVPLGVKSVNGKSKLYLNGAYWSKSEAEDAARLFEILKTITPYILQIDVKVPADSELLSTGEMLR